MTAPTRAMATRNGLLTTAKALDRALCQAEFDATATDSAPFFYRIPIHRFFDPPHCPEIREEGKRRGEGQTT